MLTTHEGACLLNTNVSTPIKLETPRESCFLMKADWLWGADDMLSLITQGWGMGPPTRDTLARGKSGGQILKKQQHKPIAGGPMGFLDEGKG